MAQESVQRRLAAILAADMVGYSRLMGQDEEGTLAALTALRIELIEPCLARHHGRLVKTTGDGLLVEFASVVDAVRCAIAFQDDIKARNAGLPDDRQIVFRIGINLGDVMVQETDVFGDGVNVAARLEGLAEQGTIVVSGTVYEHVRGKLDCGFEDLGMQSVKNIAEPVRAWRIATTKSGGLGLADALPLPDKPSIAVLPFDNLSGDPDQEYFADGIAEDIITALSRFRWFFVIARNSCFSYKGTSPDIRKVARELGVQYVLEGSVRKAGEQVRITAQLIDAASGRHVWAERYDRHLHDIFLVQDEITGAISGAIAPSFVSAEARRIERKAPENVGAWDCAIRGNWHFWHLGQDDLTEAKRLFERAVELDPKMSMAFAGLALATSWEVIWGWTGDVAASRAAELEFAERAVAVDDEDAWAHATLGFVCTHARRNRTAVRALQQALDLNPNLAFAEGALALTYAHMGDADRSFVHADRADRLSPRDPARVVWTIARWWSSFVTGDYDKALEWVETLLHSHPSLPAGWRIAAAAYAQLGRIDEARSSMANLLRMAPRHSASAIRQFHPSDRAEDLERYIEALRKAGLPE